MFNQIHFGSQYLAVAGKSYLQHKTDDSHTNIGFNSSTKSFETWNLKEDGLKLLFDLTNFQLKWSSGESFALHGKTHAQTLAWLQSSSKLVGLEKSYSFELHYDLPFEWDDNFMFELTNESYLVKEIELRTLANKALDTFLNAHNLKSDIRIWPHHFDTGAFVVLEGSEKSIGLGMAVPDSLINDHYFYISGYLGHEALETSNFQKLSIGEWKTKEFKGGVLLAEKSSEQQVVQFLQEAFSHYSNLDAVN